MVAVVSEEKNVVVQMAVLLEAVKDGKLETVLLLLGGDTDQKQQIVNTSEPSCGSLFCYAVCYGTAEIVEAMLPYAKKDGYSQGEFTPLDYALSNERFDLIRLLCQHNLTRVNHPLTG